MKAAVLYSGGKDSNLALHKAKEAGYEIKHLITLLPVGRDSWMWHWPNAKWTTLQAKAMRLNHITNETKIGEGYELKSLEDVLSKAKGDIDTIVAGAIASRYQADRIKGICGRMGLEIYTPLWGRPPEEIWQELLDLGFEVIIISVSAEGLGKEWLGRKIDRKSLEELKKLSKKYSFHLGGEGGEFETFVLNGPDFKKKIKIVKAEETWDNKTKSGQYTITEARLV